jgi:hypothetical protein
LASETLSSSLLLSIVSYLILISERVVPPIRVSYRSCSPLVKCGWTKQGSLSLRHLLPPISIMLSLNCVGGNCYVSVPRGKDGKRRWRRHISVLNVGPQSGLNHLRRESEVNARSFPARVSGERMSHIEETSFLIREFYAGLYSQIGTSQYGEGSSRCQLKTALFRDRETCLT